MRQRGGGSIINTGSVHGLGGAGNLFAYSVSKGGLLTMTKNLAVALAHDRIRVNYLIPGWVLSRTEVEIQKREGRDADWLQHKGEHLPMGRFQTPEDAANIIAFLASDEAAMGDRLCAECRRWRTVRCMGTEDASQMRCGFPDRVITLSAFDANLGQGQEPIQRSRKQPFPPYQFGERGLVHN